MATTTISRPQSSTNSLQSAKLKTFCRFAAELNADGKPLAPYREQRLILADYFAGVKATVALLPKKNGKSTMMAALALYHLLTTPDAACVIVAAARDQAGFILDQARKMIRRSPDLQRYVRAKQREVVSLVDEGKVRVLASDVDTADGLLPTLGIVDELHRHRSAELYGIVRDGLGPRDGQMITISTAGASTASPLGLLRQRAHEMPGFTRDEERRYNYVRSPNGAFAFHEWCLSPEDDVEFATVKRANPAPWKSVEDLAEFRADPSMTPWRWLRFHCGIWTEGEEPWIEPQIWDALADPSMTIGPDEDVWLGWMWPASTTPRP